MDGRVFSPLTARGKKLLLNLADLAQTCPDGTDVEHEGVADLR